MYYRTIKPYNFSRSASSLFCTLRDLFTGHRTYMSRGHAFMVFINSLSETLRVQGDVWGCAKLRFTFETIIPLVTFQIPLRAKNIGFFISKRDWIGYRVTPCRNIYPPGCHSSDLAQTSGARECKTSNHIGNDRILWLSETSVWQKRRFSTS